MDKTLSAVRAFSWTILAFLRGPKRPTVLGAFSLLFYVLAGFSLNVTVGLAVAGLYFTLMDWRFSGVDEDGGRG